MKRLLFVFLYYFAAMQSANAQCTIQPVNLGNDTAMCQNQSLMLNASVTGPYDSYLWNNNSTSPTRFVTQPGTYSVEVTKLGANQIVNGDFEQGNSGFTTDYLPGTGGSFGLLSNEGTYAISTSPSNVHNNFNFCQDHTTGTGNQMMIVNGSNLPNTTVWCQTITVQPNTEYQFGAWVSSALFDNNVALLQFSVNGANLGSTFSPSVSGCNWSQFFQVWNSGSNTSVQICITNQNSSVSGNDFMIDDISFRPLCKSQDTIVVSYNPLPIVNLGPDQSLCETNAPVLDAQNPGASYSWNSGETTQTIIPSASGVYAVTVTTPFNCSASDNINIQLENLPQAGLDTALTFCHTSGVVDFNTYLPQASPTGGNWHDVQNSMNAALSTNGIANISSLSGNHILNYVVNGTLCPNDTAEVLLTVYEQPEAGNNNSAHLCNEAGESLDLNQLTSASLVTLSPEWYETSINPSGQFNAASGILDLSSLSAADYTFAYVLPADSPCLNDTSEFTIQITEIPVVQFSSDVSEGCEPLNVNFLNESIYNGNSQISWILSDGTVSNEALSWQHEFSGAGQYDVYLSITSDGLCTASLDLASMITVHHNPIADFDMNPQHTYSTDPTVNFENKSQNNDFNYWFFDDGEQSTETNPAHTFPIGEIGKYNIMLLVETVNGCVDSISKILDVRDQLLYFIPNAFTPDNDEFNQNFSPVMTAGFATESYLFRIFNRWGELVFQTSDINVGWDGTYGGKLVAQGTYTWTLQFRDDDTDEKFTDQGHVLLFR